MWYKQAKIYYSSLENKIGQHSVHEPDCEHDFILSKYANDWTPPFQHSQN